MCIPTPTATAHAGHSTHHLKDSTLTDDELLHTAAHPELISRTHCDEQHTCQSTSTGNTRPTPGHKHPTLGTERTHTSAQHPTSPSLVQPHFTAPSSTDPPATQAAVRIYDIVSSTRQYNYQAARIPLNHGLNIPNWRRHLAG